MPVARSQYTAASSAFIRSYGIVQRRKTCAFWYFKGLESQGQVLPVKRRLPYFRRVYTSQADTFPSPSSSPDSEESSRPAYPRSFFNRTARFLALALISTSLGFIMATAPIASTVNGLIHPPTDAETLELFEPPTPSAEAINALILNHPLAQVLRADPRYTESRPHMKIPSAARPNNLTAGTLLGDDKIVVPPLSFAEPGGASLISLQYLGNGLCGHPGIIHGGLLATLLDEGLARCCFPALPNHVGVTANLSIKYLKPCIAGQVVVLRAKTIKVEGRKAWVEGWIETSGEVLEEEEELGGVRVRKVTEGEKLCSAEALFIEPKSAATMPRVYSSQ